MSLGTRNLDELVDKYLAFSNAFSPLGNGLKFVLTVKPKEKPDFVTKQI